MYGVQTTSGGLQKFAANKLKLILLSLTKRPVLAVVFGTIMTVAFQSSAATTVLVVEFVNAGLLSLAQALGIVLGSAVGTSIAIQLIAFKMLNIALGFIFIGFILYFFVGVKQWKYLGQALIGFGIIFVGMNYMSGATAPLKDYPQVYSFIAQLGTYPLVALIVGLLLTTIAQSSTVVIAIMISLAGQHLLPVSAIIPLVLGAHTGGTITALFSSLVAQKMDAKRTAIANTAYKVVGTILVLPFLAQFSNLIQWTTGDLQRQVANAHLLFAVFMVIVFLPLNSIIARLLVRLLPSRLESNPRLQLKFIDQSSLEVPTVALSQAFQEIRSVGQFIFDKMIQKMPEALLASNDESVMQVEQAEEDVDWYYHNISRLLSSLSLKGLTEEQIEEKINAQFILKEFEYIADEFMSMVTIVRKVHRETLIIPQEEWDQLSQLYDKITDNFATVLKALEGRDVELAAQAIREHPEISRVHRALQFAALAQCPRVDLAARDIRDEEKIIYARIDLINSFYGIDEHLVNIAQVVLGIV